MNSFDPIKVLVFAKAADGGTGSFLISMLELPKYLEKARVKAIILEKTRYRKIQKKEVEFYKKRRVITSPYTVSVQTVSGFLYDFRWYLKKVNEFNPQIVISIDAYCNIIVLIAKLLVFPRRKTILTTHINLRDTIKAKSSKVVALISTILIKALYQRTDVLVGVSPQTASSLRRYFGIKKKVVPIYLGLSNQGKRLPKKRRNRSKTVISIGRLDRQKDFPTLIKAFGRLNRSVRDANLIIVGDGELRSELAALISALKLDNNVRLLGWQQDVYPLLHRADVFVLSTKREGFGYVILEAMAQGLPIVATNVPYGPSEVLANGKYGILVKPNDVNDLAKKLEKILLDDRVYELYSKKSYERSSFFSEEKMLLSYRDRIISLLS